MKNFLTKQRQKDFYSVRFKSSAGRLTNAQLLALYGLAEKFGAGYVYLTSRQELSIPFVKKEDLEEIQTFCAANDLKISPSGTVFKTVTACQGDEVCPMGIISSSAIAREIDKQHDAREMPFKITCAVTGCPNNCMKVDHNDFGVMGAVKPLFNQDNCIYCGMCARVCPDSAIAVDLKAKSWTIDRDKCINCGRCVKACKESALSAEVGYKVFFAGKSFLPLIKDEATVYKVIDAATNYFIEHAKTRERLGKLLERLGTDEFIKAIRNERVLVSL